MTGVAVSASSPLTPAEAWKIASDLSRIDEWMTIFGGWRSSVPSQIERGTKLSSLIKVKGFRNVIHWTVTDYQEPRRLELSGRGRGGVRIAVRVTVADDPDGSTFHLDANLSGGLLRGPVGRLVVRAVRSDVHQSVANLAGLS